VNIDYEEVLRMEAIFSHDITVRESLPSMRLPAESGITDPLSRNERSIRLLFCNFSRKTNRADFDLLRYF